MKAVLLLALVVGAMAAEPAAVAEAAVTALTAEVAATRTAQAQERADLLARLAAAQTRAEGARRRWTAAEAGLAAAEEAARQHEAAAARSRQEVAQRVERILAAAKMPVRPGADRPETDRLALGLEHLARRGAALEHLLAERQAPEAVVGRSGVVATVPVRRWAEARAVALGDQPDHRGLLERTADGLAWRVVGPDPGPCLPGQVPLDASGQAAHRPHAPAMTVARWVAAGRAFIWPILAVGVLGVVLVLLRLVALLRNRFDGDRLLLVIGRAARDGVAAGRTLVLAGRTPLDRVLGAGLGAMDLPREARQAVVEQALLAESACLGRGLPAIAVLAGIAPLLGLLGTVTGMIDLFSVIAQDGSGGAKAVSGGISEALICTQAGMLVAIPLLVAHAWLGRLADRRTQVLEEAAWGVLGLADGPTSEVP